MVRTTITYQSDLHCEATHGPSGSTLETDAPVDNNGRGESFSPTDLVATALGTCALTVMGINAQRLGVDISGATATVDKEMVADPVRRIGKLAVRIKILQDVSAENREKLEHAAHTCPVFQSINPAVEAPIEFDWG